MAFDSRSLACGRQHALCVCVCSRFSSFGAASGLRRGVTEFYDTCHTVEKMLGTFDRLPPPAHRTPWGRKLQGPPELVKAPRGSQWPRVAGGGGGALGPTSEWAPAGCAERVRVGAEARVQPCRRAG